MNTLSILMSLAIFAVVSVPPVSSHSQMNLHFYMHDQASPPHATVVKVAAANGNLSNFGFGSTFVIDDLLTKGSHRTSTRVGRAQGFYTVDSQTGIDLLLSFTAVMETAEHNGSTICIQGADRTGLAQREVAVVGGTGAFRFARGYAVIETYSVYGAYGENAILKFNVTLRF